MTGKRPNPHAYFGDDLAAAVAAQLSRYGGEPPPSKPATALGLTMRQAQQRYSVPMRTVRRAFIYGSPPAVAPIGKRDPWDVWYTTKSEADQLFGDRTEPTPLRPASDEATRTDAEARAAARFEALMARLGRAA